MNKNIRRENGEDKLRERNLGDKSTRVSRKEIGVTSGKGIQETKVGED